MNIQKLLLIAVILTGFTRANAQEVQAPKIKKINIQNVYIQTGGMFFHHNSYGSLADFKTLAPQSIMLKNDFSEYSYYFDPTTPVGMFSVMLGIKFSDKQKSSYKANPQLRLGFTYYSGLGFTGNSEKSTYYPFDTLTSAQTGQTIITDSVKTSCYYMDYTSDQLRFDGSLIYSTNQKSRVSLYAGIGVTAGFAINANTNIYYTERIYVEDYGFNYPYSNELNSHQTESFINKKGFGFSAYIPLGIDFRLGKKREFWKRLHLNYEIRPGINMVNIPELRTIADANISHEIGLRVSID